MRIGIDARMYGSFVTGIGVYVRELTKALFGLDASTRFHLWLRPEEARRFSPPNSRVTASALAVPWYSWREQLSLPRQISRERCDLVHFPNFNVPLGYRGKFVVTIHDLTPLRFPGPLQARSRFRRLAYRTVLRAALHNAAAIIAVSRHTADEITAFDPQCRNRITVVYPGLSPTFSKPANHDKIQEQLQRYGVRQPYLFYTGVWRDHKNLPGLISAFKILLNDFRHDIQLVLGGSRENEDPRIAPLLATAPPDRIRIVGFISDQDLPLWYQGAAVTVIPSFNEGFGFNALESLACGTPVAASATTSLPEVVGDAARYFPPENPRAMASVIHEVLQPKVRQELVLRAENVVTRYQWQTAARATHAIYQRAAGE